MGNKKVIYWVVGSQLSGKTTTAKTFAFSGCSLLHIGEELRKKASVIEFGQSENPYAPEFTEKIVQSMIVESVNLLRVSKAKALVIDSAPRNNQQFNMLLKFRHEFKTVVVFVSCEESLRKTRAMSKYKTEEEREYFLKREVHEAVWLRKIQSLCEKNSVELIEVEN